MTSATRRPEPIKHAFRERARTGQLRVWAREGSPVGPLRLLPADAWRYIEFRRNDILVVPVPGREPICYFSAIVAPSANAPVVASVVASTIAAEKQCREWLVSLMAGGTQPEAPKDRYFREAQERFEVSKRGFVRAWDAAIAETENTHWRRSGPRSPRNS